MNSISNLLFRQSYVLYAAQETHKKLIRNHIGRTKYLTVLENFIYFVRYVEIDLREQSMQKKIENNFVLR